jgi:hypothetical protein
MNEKRTCGECTLCCKTHGIWELKKVSGCWCMYCSVGKGCMIYGRHPPSCRDFACAWLKGVGLPEYRPDKTGVVPEFREVLGLGLGLFLWVEEDTALDSDFVRTQTRLNLERNSPVMHIPVSGAPKLYLPRGKQTDREHMFGGFRQIKVEVIPFKKGRF